MISHSYPSLNSPVSPPLELDCPELEQLVDIEFVHANGLDSGDEARRRGLSTAQAEIQKLVTYW
jgi:hypothetical protein